VIGGFGSPLCSAGFWPAHIQVKVVEVGILQIASMPNDAAGWQRRHFDLLAILDNMAERLEFDQAIAKINDTVFEFGWDIVDADIRPAELSHAASMVPLQGGIGFFRDEDHRVMTGNWGSRIKNLLFPIRRLPPAEHERIVDRASAVMDQISN
jgi:hypothetical protein